MRALYRSPTPCWLSNHTHARSISSQNPHHHHHHDLAEFGLWALGASTVLGKAYKFVPWSTTLGIFLYGYPSMLGRWSEIGDFQSVSRVR